MGPALSSLVGCRCAPGLLALGEFEWSPHLGAIARKSTDVSPSSKTLSFDDDQVQTMPGEEELPAHRRPRERDRAALDFIGATLRSNQIFAFLDDSEIDQLAGTFHYHVFNAGECVVKEGVVGTCFFVAEQDGLEVFLRGGQVGTISAGSTFGEMALLTRCPRSVSIVAARPEVGVWAADARLFRRAVQASVMLQVSDNRAFLDSVGLLEGLSAREVDCVCDVATVHVLEPGVRTSRQGETGCVYFVKSGELRLVSTALHSQRADETVYGPGSCVGERLLLYSEPICITAEAVKRSEVLRMNVRRLRQLLGRDLSQIRLQQGLLQSSMKKSGLFSQLPQAQLVSAVQAMEFCEYAPGARIPETPCFLVVLDGSIQVGARPVARVLSRGQWHGPTSWSASPASDTSPQRQAATAAGDNGPMLLAGHCGCRLAVLPAEGASGFRCEDPERIYARMAQVMSKVSVFMHLSKAQIDMLVRGTIRHTYRKGEQVVVQGQSGSHFFIVADGEARSLVNGREVRKLVKHTYFGERSILFDEPRATTVQVTSVEAEIWALDKDTFMKVVREKTRLSEQLIYRIWLQDAGLELQDLRRVGVVGCGTSGVVHLVKHQRTGFKYALKRVDKKHGKVPREVKREVEVLAENDHPFIMHLVKTIETPNSVYLITEYIGGGELHAAIRSISTVLSRWQAMFYTASMVLMLETLNNRNVVYRDLKPENVMLDDHGYLKLIDFGSAKRLEKSCPRTFTMVGTPHYMAPEVMRGKGYGIEVDVWALGVVLYELVCGYLPFGDHTDNTAEVCKAVMAGNLEFPRDTDPLAMELITGLLASRPHQRLGCGPRGYDEIKSSPFFDLEHFQSEAGGTCRPGADFFGLLLGRELLAPIPPLMTAPAAGNEDDKLSDIDDIHDVAPRSQQSMLVSSTSKEDPDPDGDLDLDPEQTVDCEPEEEGDPEEPERIPAIVQRPPPPPPPTRGTQ